jgi:hypothetical protein
MWTHIRFQIRNTDGPNLTVLDPKSDFQTVPQPLLNISEFAELLKNLFKRKLVLLMILDSVNRTAYR